ncbi:MAG: hypothetical protein IPL78_34090 [Chloroflexi bacterium]|nr:hypothetical protein [Chloroflexota bacterium]
MAHRHAQDEETDETSDEQGQLPAWLSGLTSLDEPVAAAAAEPDLEITDDLSAWLQDLSAPDELDENDDTAQKKTEFITAEDTEAPSSLAEVQPDMQTPPAAARETITMADSPQKDPNRPDKDNSNNELNWLDELANLPLDEPSTVPSSSTDPQIADEDLLDWLPDEDGDLSDDDSAWLDALSPAEQRADQTLDWLEQIDQPKVEEAPTLSWLSDDELHGQTSGAFNTAEAGEEEDLEEAMAWLESLVTEQDEEVLSPLEPAAADTANELDWFSELADLETEDVNLSQNHQMAPTEEAPTITESIPSASAEEADLADLFTLESSDESPEQIAAAMSWLDELASASSPDTNDALINAGLPPEDPEAAMAWLEQLAAAQADEADEELESPLDLSWASTTDEPADSIDWLEQLSVDAPTSEVEPDEPFFSAITDLEQPLGEEIPDWLDNLAESSAEETMDQPASQGLPNWLDELTGPTVDEIIPSESLIMTQPSSEPIDWLDEIAAADETFDLETPNGETLPNWFDELTDSATAESLIDDQPVEDQASHEITELAADNAAAPTPMAEQPIYVPPTHISAEAAKILDMSDLFEMDDVEESEEDMAQAMAWMNELIGDLGQPAPVAKVEPAPVEAAASMDWLDELAELPQVDEETETVVTTVSATPVEPAEPIAAAPTPMAEQPIYVPPTHISAEAAKILDMSDLFEMDDVEESEEDMAQAMAWMNELIGDLGQPAAATPSAPPLSPLEPEVITLVNASAATSEVEEPMAETMDWLDELAEPVSTASVPATDMVQVEQEEDEAMSWLDEIVAEMGDEPVAAAPSQPSDSADEADEAMDWLNEIVADMTGEPVVASTRVVEEPPTLSSPQPPQEERPQQPAQPIYVPPTHISAEAAKILDMSDLFEMDDVEESEEDMAQAMAWMNELIGDLGQPAAANTIIAPPQPADELPTTIISATPVVEEDDSALSWLNNLATQDEPIAALPDLDEPFTVDDLETATPTPQDEEVAMDWLTAMTAEQSNSFDSLMGSAFTSTNDDLLDELTGIPEDPDAAMDWLDQMSAQQTEEPATTLAQQYPVIKEARTPSVPVEVMDALVQIETKRQKAQTGPLKLPELPKLPPDALPQEEDAPNSLINELTSGDVAESLPDWLSLDNIGAEEMPLSWLSGRDLDATGWLESEGEMVDAEPIIDTPYIAPSEPVTPIAEPQRRETEAAASASSDTMAFAANLDVRADDGQLAAARQLLQTRKYDEAITQYSGLLEQSASVSPLITELETVVDSHPAQPLLRRLLGDAYMRNGQLQKALETYRKALDQL